MKPYASLDFAAIGAGWRVLRRHRLVEDFCGEHARWLERYERDADRRVSRHASEMAQWRARPTFFELRDEGELNCAAPCNKRLNADGGEVAILMNNDITPIDGKWLRELVTVNSNSERSLRRWAVRPNFWG